MIFRAGEDAEQFEKQWPEAKQSYASLCKAIRKKHCPGRLSRNGTPEERREKAAAMEDSDFSFDSNNEDLDNED